jgi:hypothetical protein
MRQISSRTRLIETILLAGSSILLYNLGLGIVLFLIPLQILAVRWGSGSMSAAGAAAFVFIFAESAVRFFSAGRTEAAAFTLGLGLTIAFFMISSLVVVNLHFLRRFRALVRLLIAALLTGLVAIPLIALVPSLPGFQTTMQSRFTEFSALLHGLSPIPEADSMGPLFALYQSPERLMKLFEQVFLRTFLLYYFILLVFQWWAGTAAASRTIPFPGRPAVVRLSSFHLENLCLWPLIVSGALVLLDVTVGIWAFGYAAWNAGLVFMFLFGVQGMAIIKFLFEKYRLPQFLWAAMVLALAILLVYWEYPELNLFFMIAIPALGVSENWIRLRVPLDAKAED